MKPEVHVANIDYGAFYSEIFPSLEESRKFVDVVDSAPGRAKVLLHQVARMVWLADRLDEVARGRPALQIMFYMIGAEAAAKLFYDFKKEGHSRQHARLFFLDLCEAEHKVKLESALYNFRAGKPLSAENAVDFLYDVRCDVAHRGQYYNLHLPDPNEEHEYMAEWKGSTMIVRLTVGDLRRILLRGAISACRRMPPLKTQIIA